MIEFSILKAFAQNKGVYLKYNKFINLSYIKTNFKDLYKVYNTLVLIYTKHENTSITRDELEGAYLANYPVLKDTDRRELAGLLDRIWASKVDEALLADTLEAHYARALAGQLAITALEVNEGKKPPEALREAYKEFDKRGTEIGDTEFVSDDLEALYKTVSEGNGIPWPLPCLREAMAPLRKGNMGFVFARPEGGKTTFMSQFVTHAVNYVDKPIIWFNNEQPGEEVKIRLYQATFGITTQELFRDRSKYQALYAEKTKGLILLLDDAIIDRVKIEQIAEQYQPSLMVFDQIDKIQGFSSDKKQDRYDLELGTRYQWARELAKAYCPVIGVTQADASGENVKYLTMANVANAKTAKQAEADWILGIGSSNSDDFKLYRYLNISKNKMIGDENTKAELRHGKFQVIIEPEIARYREV